MVKGDVDAMKTLLQDLAAEMRTQFQILTEKLVHRESASTTTLVEWNHTQVRTLAHSTTENHQPLPATLPYTLPTIPDTLVNRHTTDLSQPTHITPTIHTSTQNTTQHPISPN